MAEARNRADVMVFGAESTILALREFGKFDDEAKGLKKELYKRIRAVVT